MPFEQYGKDVAFGLFVRVGQGFGDFFQYNAFFFFVLVQGQGGVKKHVGLNFHTFANIFRRGNHHEIGVIIGCVGVIVSAD